MKAVVEFHAFRNNQNQYILKEFVVLSDFFNVNIVFSSPAGIFNCSKVQKTIRWLTRYFHKIKWEDGTFIYRKQFVKNVLSQFSVIYTKGSEKVEFLRKFHNNVVDICCVNKVSPDYVCPYTCTLPQHTSKGVCALRSACFYFNYLKSINWNA
jgi:hypothetical protein